MSEESTTPTADGGRFVLVVHVTPSPAPATLLAAAFDAAAHLFGVRAIEDVLEGPPAGMVLVVLSPPYSSSPQTVWSTPLLETGMDRALRDRGAHACDLRVLGPIQLGTPDVEAQVDEWVDRLRTQASVSARRLADRAALDTILARDELTVLAQPIVVAGQGSRVGWELFCHGPAAHFLEPPGELIRAARASGRNGEVQRAMVRAALGARIPGAGPEDLLFVNTDPDALTAVVDELELWVAAGGDATRVVIEVTETRPIDDLGVLLRERDRAAGLGARLALDDVGAGNAGIATLAALTPSFIKLDRSLVCGCHADAWRRGIIGALVFLADRTGARVIGEGVEEQADLTTLTDLGVHLVQGYITGAPRQVESHSVDLRGIPRLSRDVRLPAHEGGGPV